MADDSADVLTETPGTTAPDGSAETALPDIPGEPESTAFAPEAPEAAEASKPVETPSSEVAKYLRTLRADETGGKYSRTLEGAYFRDREFVKAFPTVEEAKNARMLLDGIGGLDGIEELQRAGELLTELDEMAARGDPELINRLAEDNPQGFVGFTEAGLEKLRQTNREAYDAVVRPHVIAALSGTNLSFALRSAADILAAGNQQGAFDYLQSILGWLDGLAKESTSSRQQAAVASTAASPAAAVAPEFTARLETAAAPGVMQAIQTAMQPYAQQRGLSDASKTRLQTMVLSEIDRQLGADEQYQRTLRTLARGQNPDRAAKFVISKVDQVASRITREVVNDLYPGAKPAAAPQAAPASGRTNGAAKRAVNPSKPGVPIMLPKGPSYEEVNWEHDPNKVLYVTHKAFLHDGRYVTWPK